MSDHDSEMSTTTNSPPTPQEPELIIIHTGGDLDLFVGDKSLPTCKRLRVWTGILKLTSKIFAAMVSPSYAEGQQNFSPESPGTIDLTYDDPSAMTFLLQILHMRFHNNFLGGISSGELLKICIVADKYQCMEVVGPALVFRMQQLFEDTLEYSSDFELLTASWMIGDPRFFRRLSKRLIAEYSDPLRVGFRDIPKDVFPADVAWMISSYRLKCRNALLENINNLVTTFLSPHLGGLSGSISASEAKIVMRLYGEICQLTHGRNNLALILASLQFFEATNDRQTIYYVDSTSRKGVSFMVNFKEISKKLSESLAGLCLRCCREKGEPGTNCDGKHDTQEEESTDI